MGHQLQFELVVKRTLGDREVDCKDLNASFALNPVCGRQVLRNGTECRC